MIKAEIGGIFKISRKWKLIVSVFLLFVSFSNLREAYEDYIQSGIDGWLYYMIILGVGNLFLAFSVLLSYFNPPYLAIEDSKVYYKPNTFHRTVTAELDNVKIVHDTKLSFILQMNNKSYQLSYSLFDFKNMQNVNRIKELIFESNSVDIAKSELETV